MRKIKCAVQCGLPAHGGQQRIRALDFNNFFYRFPGNWLDIGHIGGFRVCHDGSRIAVDQNGAIAFGFQGFARLCTRIIKFAGLTNNDRTGADNQYAFYVGTLGHDISSFFRSWSG